MAIIVQKTIPTDSQFYSGGGDTTVTLYGVQEITINSMKELINIKKAKTKTRQAQEDTDQFDVSVIDLKKGQDQIAIKGWIEDDGTSNTGWEQYWKLRAMCSRGGPLTSLTLDNIVFDGSSDRQQAYLEKVQATTRSNDIQTLTTDGGPGVARVELLLNFLIGDER